MKPKRVIVADSSDIQNLLIQVNLKRGTTTVISSISAWENLALIMEALKVTAEQCIAKGIPKKKVDESINSYMTNLFANETMLIEHK